MLPFGKTILPFGKTILPFGKTILSSGKTILPFSKTVLLKGGWGLRLAGNPWRLVVPSVAECEPAGTADERLPPADADPSEGQPTGFLTPSGDRADDC